MQFSSVRRARRAAQAVFVSALSISLAIAATDAGAASKAKAKTTKKKAKVTATTTTAAPATTAAPTTAAPSTAAAGPLFQVAPSQLGNILVDRNGLSLYLFDPDAKKPGGSACNGQCADVWPPVLVKSDADLVAPAGFTGKLTTVKRDDGTLQAAVNGWPLYGWVFDKVKGDLNGQAFQEVWWALDGAGNPNRTAPTLRLRSNKVGTANKNVLVDPKGFTLYMFDNDKKDATNCYDQCAAAWPPLLVTSEAQLQVLQASGIDASKIKLIRRADTASLQVSYNGWPLYTWARDTKPGDTTGIAVNNAWWTLDATGTPIK